MFEAYKKMWKRMTDFDGKSTRSDYWWAQLAAILLYVAYMASSILSPMLWNFILDVDYNNATIGSIVGSIFGCSIAFVALHAIPMLSLGIRRLHDVGESGWFYLIVLVPVIGWIWLLVLLCKRSKTIGIF